MRAIPRLEVHVDPSQRRRLSEAHARVGEEEHEREGPGEARRGDVENSFELGGAEHLLRRDRLVRGAAPSRPATLPRLHGVRLHEPLTTRVREDQPEHVQRHVDRLRAARAARVEAVVVEHLDLCEADLPDVGAAEVGPQVNVHLEAVDARGAVGVVALMVALDRELDFATQPVLREKVEGNRLPTQRGRRSESPEGERRVDLARDLLGLAVVCLRRADAFPSTPPLVVGDHPPRPAIHFTLALIVGTASAADAPEPRNHLPGPRVRLHALPVRADGGVPQGGAPGA